VDLLISLVRTDNEENALLCIKTIIDIMRHQTKVLGDKFQPFLALIQHMFDQIKLLVMDQLDTQSPHNSIPGISPPGSSQTHENSPRPGSSVASISDPGLGLRQQTLPLPKAMASFKVLAECLTIAQSTFQVYQSSVSMDIKPFFLFIESVLLLQAKHQEQAHATAAANGTIFTGVSPDISNRPAFGDFIGIQVKAISFLAYLLKDSQLSELTELDKFLPALPHILIRLLKDCPREKSGVRKELLMAIRDITNFHFRIIFLEVVDDLLDPRILIGDSLTVYETLRPLAYSMLTDLINHLQDALKPPQIRKTVEVYIKNLQDNFPGTTFQTMSAKLLLDMAECIAKMPNKVDASHYLIMILNAIGDKFAAINRQYPNAVKLSKLYAQQSVDGLPDNYLVDNDHLPDWDEIDIFTATPIMTSNPRDRGADPVADNKYLFKNLVDGLTNIFHQLKACKIGSPIGFYGFTAEEVQVIIKLFREGAYVFRYYYEIDKPATESHYTNALELMADRYISGTKEEKNLLKRFVVVLLYIDQTTSHEILHDQIPIALDRVPQLSQIFPTLIQQYEQMNHLETFFKDYAEYWFDLLIWSVLDIEKNAHKIRSNPIRALRKNLLGPLQAAKSCFCTEPSWERIDDEWLDLEKSAHKIRSNPIRAGLRKNLIGPLREIWPASRSERIDGGWLDLEKSPLRTQNSQFGTRLCKGLVRPFQKLSIAATSRLCIKPSVKTIIDAMLELDVKNGVLRAQNSPFRAALCESLVRLSQKISFAATSDLCLEPSIKIIIDAVLDVEEGVRRTQSSTFRATLYKYLNCFPQEVCPLLLRKIEEQKYGRFLAQLLEHPEGGPLRKFVAENIEILIKNSGDKGAEKEYTAVINSILILHSLCKFEGDREWMDKEDIIIWLKMVGRNLEAHLRTNTLPPHLRLAAEQASEQLMVIFTKFLEYHPTDLDALFSLIDSVTNEDFPPTQPLFAYIYNNIICSNSIEYWKTIVLWSLEVYASKSASQKTKTFLLHNIVSPIIATSKQTCTKSPGVIDEALIESINTKIWKVSLGDPNDDFTQPGVDHTRIEVLQLTAMLVKYYHSVLRGTSQDIIKFGLTCLEDIVCKYAANVVIGYCIAHFETPVEIIQQVYTSLLESSHHEGRVLVTQALELIAPALPNLCNAVPNDRSPFWVAIPRRILEGKDVQQRTTVFHFLVKHADLFYKYRENFIILIVKSLPTIAQLPNPSNQSKQLVLQLMTLVWQWEQQRVEDSGEQLITPSTLSMLRSTLADTSEYKTPTWARAVINYLAEFIVSLRQPLPHRLLHSIEILLAGEPTDNNWVNSMINALQVVRIIIDVMPNILKKETYASLCDETEINGLKMKPLLERGSVS
jgi:hypothetical protein